MPSVETDSRYTITNLLTRDFIFAFLGLFSFLTAMYALFPTLPIYLVKLDFSVREIGIVIGVYGASSLAFRFVVGGALLRYPEKNIMIVGSLLSLISFLASVVFQSFWPLFVIRFLQGVALATIDTAALAFVIKTMPQAHRGEGMGYFLLAPTFSLAVAPSCGMWLVNHYNFTTLFLTCTGFSVCAFLFSWRLKKNETFLPNTGTDTRQGLFFELKVVVPAVTNFLQSFVWGAVSAFFPLYAVKCGVLNPGHFFTAIAVMLLVGRALGSRVLDLYSKEKIIISVLALYTFVAVVLSFSRSLPMFIFAGLLWGAGGAFFYPASIAHALEYAGSSSGTAVGTVRAIMDLGLSLGPVAMGMVLPLIDYHMMFLCLAFICLVNLVYFQFYVRRAAKQA
jgi:predicted MFS family arabinose efflux permease